MKKEGILLLFAVIFLSGFVSAEIFLSQPLSAYNLGDDFKLDIGVSEANNAMGFLEVNSVCQNSTESQIYKNPLSVKAGERKEISISAVMEKYIVGNSLGECFFRVKYNNQQKESQVFYISDHISINVENLGFSFDPGKSIEVKGTAVKRNGKNLEGYLESRVSEIGIIYTAQISDGKFHFNLTIPENAKSGVYALKIHAYDNDESGNKRNAGDSSYTLKINQIPKRLEVAFNSQNITPGDPLVYSINVYDQANDLVKTEVSSEIYSPSSEISEKGIIESGKYYTFNTTFIYAPDYWTVEGKLNDLSVKRSFLIEKLMKVSYTIENNTLVVTNVGNVPYKKEVIFKIGNESVIYPIDLEIGESEIYQITAETPGQYELSVYNEGNDELLGFMSVDNKYNKRGLAGLAVYTPSEISSTIKTGLWVIIFLILILGTVYYYVRVRKKSYYGAQSSSSAPVVVKSVKGFNAIETGSKKEEAVVIALKIKNHVAVMNSTSTAPDAIKSALSTSDAQKYLLSDTDEFKVMVLSLSTTGSQDNAMKAIKIAKKIESALSEYNSKFSQKIVYGLGINIGELIIEKKQDGSFSFISSGNTVPVSKKIAEYASDELLLSEDVHRRTLGSVKAEKTKDNYWKIRRIVEREGSSGFINSFKQRQGIDQNKRPRMTDNF